PVDIDITGVETLVLKFGDAGNGNNSDHNALADAMLHCAGPDVTAPTVVITTDPASPSGTGWFTTEPTVTVTVTDDDPQAYVEYAQDDSWWQHYRTKLTITDGSHTVSARATDSASNVS